MHLVVVSPSPSARARTLLGRSMRLGNALIRACHGGTLCRAGRVDVPAATLCRVSSRLVFVSSSREHPCGGPSLRLQSPSVSRPAAALAHPAPGADASLCNSPTPGFRKQGGWQESPNAHVVTAAIHCSYFPTHLGVGLVLHQSHREPEVQTGNSLGELSAGVAPLLRVNTTKHKTQTGHR